MTATFSFSAILFNLIVNYNFIGEIIMDMTLLKEGAIIMVIGMGTVFFFLAIMIGAMNINEKVYRQVDYK